MASFPQWCFCEIPTLWQPIRMEEEYGAAAHIVPDSVPVEAPAQLAAEESPAKRRRTMAVSKEEVWGPS